jgi:hypothetical protein
VWLCSLSLSVVYGWFQISAKRLYSEICTLPAKLCSLRQLSDFRKKAVL